MIYSLSIALLSPLKAADKNRSSPGPPAEWEYFFPNFQLHPLDSLELTWVGEMIELSLV